MADEYKPMGMSMANLTIGYGVMMILWGLAVSILSGSNSFTSYIPSLMGVLMLIPGILTNMQPGKKKLWMHAAVLVGALCALGGTRFFMVMSDGINYASGSMLMLLVTGSIYTYLCVQSFKHARKNKPIESIIDASEKETENSTNIVQNITYNISDSVVSGGIENNIENN